MIIKRPYNLVLRYPSELYKFPSQPLLYNWMTNLLYPLYPTTGAVRELNETEGGYPPGIIFDIILSKYIFCIILNI